MGLISRVSSRTYRFQPTNIRKSTMIRGKVSQLAKRALATSNRRLQEDVRLEPADSGRMTDIGTRRIFDEDHDAFRDMARKWFDNVVKPEHSKWEETGIVPREIWEDAGENGLLGCQTPDEHGGIGADVLHAAIVWEEQSYSNCSGPGFALHSDIVMTEPGAGSDLQGIRTYAKRDGDYWILNGSKTFITNGQNADTSIVVAI